MFASFAPSATPPFAAGVVLPILLLILGIYPKLLTPRAKTANGYNGVTLASAGSFSGAAGTSRAGRFSLLGAGQSVKVGLYRDNGKENGHHYIVYWGYMGLGIFLLPLGLVV